MLCTTTLEAQILMEELADLLVVQRILKACYEAKYDTL
jgi:hypothetical protein